ncbi:MAG TPA: hypothetical protein VNI60_05080 [Pyrinomonadaceae bacterium]|nr:hypothetical protein [Pyrinomonadaceae bacterium]
MINLKKHRLFFAVVNYLTQFASYQKIEKISPQGRREIPPSFAKVFFSAFLSETPRLCGEIL